MTAEQRRSAVTYVQKGAAVSERRACRWLGVHRAPVRYVATPRRNDGPLRTRLQQLAGDHPRWGAPLLTWQLQREGWPDNHKRIERVSRQAGLAVRKRSRRKSTRPRVPHEPASRPNTRWAMDFMRDTFATGRVFRLFNVVDDCTREPLAMAVDTSFPGSAVAAVLTQRVAARGRPDRIVYDNGPEFISRALTVWAAEHRVIIPHIQPRQPNQHACVESFNSRVRDECLNQQWFLSLADARRRIADDQHEFRTARRHSALGDRPPGRICCIIHQHGSSYSISHTMTGPETGGTSSGRPLQRPRKLQA
ncbi:MAG: IS3 family transposase [Gemmatimonas sp.]